MKRCARCHATKPLDAFLLNPRMRSGRTSYCRACSNEATQNWRRSNRAAVLAAKRAYERSRYVGKPPRAASCERCATEFVTVQPRRRYCTRDCGQRARTDRPGRPNKATRQRILNRDGWRCYLCRGDIDKALAWPHPRSASVDHVVPRSAGGADVDSNLRATHWACNEAKADSLPGVEVFVPWEVAS